MAPPRRRKGPKRKVSAIPGRLYYGDNLEIMREYVPDDSVDLIYLDPPFNSKRSYNVLFKTEGEESKAQAEAFVDSWRWGSQSEAEFQELLAQQTEPQLVDTLVGLKSFLDEKDIMAYLVMMATRLVEMKRVLKPTGSIYLHCDPSASHYLKIVMDAVFGAAQFRNEIVWHYSGWNKNMARHFERRHDVLLFYARTKAQQFRGWAQPWESVQDYVRVRKQKVRRDEEGRDYVLSDAGGGKRVRRYLEEAMAAGRPIDDVWDIDKLNNSSKERLEYPTQKPEELLAQVIESSTSEGDVVLDPFCGCGTTVAVAERLKRRWIGIDITYLAIDVVSTRLRDALPGASYSVHGIPEAMPAARALFDQNPLDFERWVVSMMDGQPNDKQVGDRGIDGKIRFPVADRNKVGTALVSVKGGKQINPAMVRELIGTVSAHGAQLGVLALMEQPTPGMTTAAAKAGQYLWPVNGRRFQKVQILTVEELLGGARPHMPNPFLPYLRAPTQTGDQLDLALG